MSTRKVHHDLEPAPVAGHSHVDLLTGIKSRTSALRLTYPGPTPHALTRILEAAVTAPDHGRLTPWRFIVIEGEARCRLGELLAQAKLAKDRATAPAQLESERLKAFRAPTIIVAAAHTDKKSAIPEIEQVVAVGAAVQNMFLTANALGYGAMWRTGTAAYDATVKEGLGLLSSDHIVGFLYVGAVLVAGAKRATSTEHVVRWL